jgi:hypothetical protein
VNVLTLLHIPKTGGTAVANGLREHVRQLGHQATLSDAPDPVITIVRDPAERFVSAWDSCARQRKTYARWYDRWPTANHAALDDEAFAWFGATFTYMFEPMTRWLRAAPYALARCAYIAHTETLDDDWPSIAMLAGNPRLTLPPRDHREANPREGYGVERSTLSEDAREVLRHRYADDYELLEAIG